MGANIDLGGGEGCNDIRECNKSYFYKMIGFSLSLNEYKFFYKYVKNLP
jgi:hypothetical protein